MINKIYNKIKGLFNYTPTLWECFCDESYYGMWAVREIGEKRWGHCFHVADGKEANGLVEILNKKTKCKKKKTIWLRY